MKKSNLYNWFFDHRHIIFLAGLLLFFILPELIEKIFLVVIPFPLILSILILSSTFLIHTSSNKRYLTFGLVFSLVVFLFIWNYHSEHVNLVRMAYIFLFTYFSFITFFLFKDLLKSDKVTTSVIIGAFAGYFMIGVISFFVYAFLESEYPDTLSTDLLSIKGIEDTFYFSFTTLTTIGYGDIVPTSVLGQKIVILEGLAGQFYLAIVMAIIVGKYLSHNPKD